MALRISASEAKRLGISAKGTPAKLCGRKPKLMSSRWSFTIEVPMQVRSEANCREHWAKKMRRRHEQRNALMAAFGASPWSLYFAPMPLYGTPLPVVVTLTPIGRQMDSDNLANAWKGARDWIASAILGVDDGDERVTWKYEQRAGSPGGVEVRIETAEPHREG